MPKSSCRMALISLLLLVSASSVLYGSWRRLNPSSNQIEPSPLVLSSSLQSTSFFIPKTIVTSTSSPTTRPTNTATPTPTKPANGERIIIGLSSEGRELEVFQFGNGQVPLLIIAGIHGGYEWNTVSLVDALMERIISHEILIPDNVTLFILRNFNPDGYEKDKGPDGRANANNVDLNRNWDSDWKISWWGTQCWSLRYITAGTEPESERETQALKDFILNFKIEQLISYHSAGLGIFSGGSPGDKKSDALAKRLAQVSKYPYPPIARDCEYTGQLANWASDNGIIAVDIELSNHSSIDLVENVNILEEFLDID